MTSKKVETSTNVTNNHEAKMAFYARGKVLGLLNKKTFEDLGIKSLVINNPNNPKGNGKKVWFNRTSSCTNAFWIQAMYLCFMV